METEAERWARLDDERQAQEANLRRVIRSWEHDPDMVAELGYRVIAAMAGDRVAPLSWGELTPELVAREWFARDWLEG